MKQRFVEDSWEEENFITIDDISKAMHYRVIKRMFDYLFAFIGICLLAPLFLIISVVIKIDDRRGPIFFKQIRVGKDGKEFEMYSFRSMHANAEEKLGELLKYNEVSGAMFKMKEDPRVTSIGKFIRKTSIDELPQLINVIKGDMSLVGPRPPLPREVKMYTSYDKQRLLITPGCTGLWQVSGRNNLDFNQMVQLDLQYIQSRSLWLDLKIIFKTFSVMMNSRGAF